MPSDDGLSDRHLSAEEIASYLDGELVLAARRRVEVHLAACDSCLRELAAALRVMRGSEEPGG